MTKSILVSLATLSIVASHSGCGSDSAGGSGASAGAQATGSAGQAASSTPSAGRAATPPATSRAGTPAANSTAAGGAAVSGRAGAAATSAASGGSEAAATPASAGAGPAPAGGSAPPVTEGKPRRAIVTDFLNQTLSIVDIDKLTEGAKREDALLGTVDMSKYVPGPLVAAVTPDGKTALVSVSSGWLKLVEGGADIPAGDGMLVWVDLETLQVSGELDVGVDPLGIAITHDGKHAFVGLMSESYMAYVDIEAKTFEPIATGNQWNEELALDDTGTVGVLTTGVAGDAMTFSVTTPTMHGQTSGLTGDAAGAVFFPGTKLVFVLQAPTPLSGRIGGYNVVDASDPAAPKVTDDVRTSNDAGRTYPVAVVRDRKSVVYPSADENTKKLSVLEMSLEGDKAKLVQTIAVADGTFAYGLTATAEGLVFAAVGAEHYIAVIDLNTGKSHLVPWNVTKTGPMDVKLIP
jgi:hypothetical protein